MREKGRKIWKKNCILNSAIIINLDEFGEDCSSNTNDLYEDDELYVEYNGKTVGFFCDSFKFSGRGVRLSDEYSVCVTPLYFNDSECAVEINIKTSNTGVSEHVCV